MKTIQTSLLLLFFLILSSVLPAQTPGAINHQMVIRDAGGAPMPMQNFTLRLSIHSASSSTSPYSSHSTSSSG